MFKEETLRRTGRRSYEEPDGEFLEMINSGSNTITVLTRDSTGKGAAVPFDPEDTTVGDLKEKLANNDYSGEELAALLGAEKDGNDRTTAKTAIKNEQ